MGQTYAGAYSEKPIFEPFSDTSLVQVGGKEYIHHHINRCMTTITSKRGTTTINSKGLVFGKRSSIVPKGETVTIKRGTDVVKVKDIPKVSQPSLKGQTITVNRGTEVITL